MFILDDLGVYKKTKQSLIKKRKKVERKVKNYLQKEIAPSITTTNFSDFDHERLYYEKFLEYFSLYEFIIEFERNNVYLSKPQKSKKLISLIKNADLDDKYHLLSIAAKLHRSEFTISALAWICIHTNRYKEAAKYINIMKNEFYSDNDKTNKLKASLKARLKVEDIEEYLESSVYINPAKNEKRDIASAYDDLITLYKEGKDKELSQIIFDRFKGNNIDELISFILIDLKRLLSFSDKSIMLILINIGKLYSNADNKLVEVQLVEEAIKIEKNTMSTRALFWAYQRQGNIIKSKQALSWLDDYSIKHNDIKLQKFVSAKKRSYLFLTASDILDLINKAKNDVLIQYQAAPNTIAYVLHNSLPFSSGGYATRGHGLANALVAEGYFVNIISRPGFPLDTKKELEEIEISNCEKIDDVRYHRILAPRKDKFVTYDYIQLASEALYQKFLEIRPSIVVGASNHLTALPALIAARRLAIPFLYEVRGFWELTRISREPEFEQTDWYGLLCSFEAITAIESDHVFTLTTPMVDELEKRGVSRNRITILPNSCNPERFEPIERNVSLSKLLAIPSSVPVIGYIGTFVQYEGLEDLAIACGILKQKGVNFRLLIVGNENTQSNDKGTISENILNIAERYSFLEWLIMPGRVPHEEVEAYYSLIDIAPFPRKPQPVTEMVSPMKPLEAAAMKKAIIVSSVKALTDMIEHKKNGLVFEKGNIEDLANKLLLLVQDENLRSSLGEQARVWVENERTWKKTAKTFIETLSNISHE